MLRYWFLILYLLSYVPCGAYRLSPEHVAVIYNTNSPVSVKMAREYVKVRNIPQDNLVPLHCASANEISRAEYTATILQPILRAAHDRRWWQVSGVASAPMLNRKIFALALMADIPMKIRHDNVSGADKNVSQQRTNAAAIDSELALMAVKKYELSSWLANPYFDKKMEFVGSGLPTFLVCRLDAATPETCMKLVTVPAQVEQNGLWGWGVIDKGGPYAPGDKWLDITFTLLRKEGIPTYFDDWKGVLPEKFPLSCDTAVYCGWYAGKANGPFSDTSFHFKPGAIAMHLHSFSAVNFKNLNQGWSSTLLERGAAVTVGNVYEPFLGGCHRFDIMMDRLLQGYTVAEAASMAMPMLSWHGVVFGDPLYRPFARMKEGNTKPDSKDRYFQGWWAANAQYGDRYVEKTQRILQSARQEPSSYLFEALALEALYRKDYSQAKELLEQAFHGAIDNRTRTRLRLEGLLVERAHNGDEAFLKESDRLHTIMATSIFLPALKEWQTRVKGNKK